ncbi:MAG: tetratricopeptide repeat protein [Pseudomonadota bacterium]
MSESDSFLNEVTEEVRRDRLLMVLNRYKWAIAAAIVVIVGGAAFLEWRKFTATTTAQANGDALRAALAEPDLAARAQALSSLSDTQAAPLARLAEASAKAQQNDPVGARNTLEALINDNSTDALLRDVARLRLGGLADSGLSVEDRLAILDALAQPGAPFAALAREQQAYVEMSNGNLEAALDGFRALYSDLSVPQGVRERAAQLLVVLGEELPDLLPISDEASEAASNG